MRLELEYHSNDQRWYWRAYDKGIVREGFARTLAEATNAGETAAGEYRSRKVVELCF